MRYQFVLDRRTNRLLDELAATRAGNRSYVVREAIETYAALDAALEEIEADAGFQRMIERSATDIRAGRVLTQAEVKKRLSSARGKK
ncbi:MAG: ribbon-helix-helix protein, CopG family [Terriglobia bacterium]